MTGTNLHLWMSKKYLYISKSVLQLSSCAGCLKYFYMNLIHFLLVLLNGMMKTLKPNLILGKVFHYQPAKLLVFTGNSEAFLFFISMSLKSLGGNLKFIQSFTLPEKLITIFFTRKSSSSGEW